MRVSEPIVAWTFSGVQMIAGDGRGQRIEVSGNDVVMKGFSRTAYKAFKNEMFAGSKQSITISASSQNSINELTECMTGKNTQTFLSRLSSVGLFFQQLGATVKSFFVGAPSTTPQAGKSQPHAVISGSASKNNVEVAASAASTPTKTLEQRTTIPPSTLASVEAKKERRQVTHAPAERIPLWVSRAKVSVASNNDLQTTRSTVENYASTHHFTDIQIQEKSGQSLTVQLVDEQGGRLSVTAEQGKSVVNIEELKRSEETPTHMSNIATELPDPGPKNVSVTGRESLQEKVKEALTTTGKHNIESPKKTENQENVSQASNRQSSGPHR